MKIVLLYIFFSPFLNAQTWFSPSPQIIDGNTVTFTSTATVRYGQNASTCVATYLTCVVGQPSPAAWLSSVTVAAGVPIIVGTTWAKSDPIGGVYKQLQIARTATDQPITVVNNSGVKTTVIVPALPTPPAPITLPYTGILSCTRITFSGLNFTIDPTSCTKVP